MNWYRARLRSALLWTVIFICFGVGFFVGLDLSGRAYLLAVYGRAEVYRHGLHIIYDRPLLVSNGDRASDLATFAYALFGMFLDVPFGCLSLVVLSWLTWLLGKRVNVFRAAAATSQSYPDQPTGPARKRAEMLIGLTIMALIVALILLIVGHSLPHTLRNHATFLVAAGLAIRVACASGGRALPGCTSEPQSGGGRTETRQKGTRQKGQKPFRYHLATGVPERR